MKRYEAEIIEASFQKCPSYNPEKQTISSEDIPLFMRDLGYDRTPEQLETYTKWWTQVHHGVLPLDLVCAILGSSDNIPKYMEALVHGCDFNKSGFISEDEFRACIHCVLVHDPDFPRVDYEEFLQQASKNSDGKVSLDEAVQWCIKNTTSK